MTVLTTPKLFQPIRVGNLELQHRVVHAPMTRFRADPAHVPTDLITEYYAQRARTPGTLIISEATFIAAKAGGYPGAPGIWSEDQVVGWKKVTDVVHSKGSYIILQLWALGRAALEPVLKAEDHSFEVVSASDIPLKDHATPHPLTIAEIEEYTLLYRSAAKNAIKAGFDGVEVHCANGYLLDQFLQDVSNIRTDIYGGSIEGRARFPLAAIQQVVEEVGEDKVGVRVTPWGEFQDMKMADPIPQFSYFANQLKEKYPKLMYLHVVEPRAPKDPFGEDLEEIPEGYSNDFLWEIWGDRPLISCGGYERKSAFDTAEKYPGGLIGFARPFISNPDLPVRLQHNVPLAKYDRSTIYSPGPKGYTDYEFADISRLPATKF